MKRSRAFDKETGAFVGFKRAADLGEAARYAFTYKCSEEGCDCTVHWRKKVHAKENTDIRAATFVKNKSSEHTAHCLQDYERIARENSAYTYLKDGAFHVRLNFPMGASNHDIFPMRGYLSEQQINAANNAKDIKPFSTLKDLVSFIEKKMGALDSEDLPEIYMHYQGRKALFDDKMIGNLDYRKLYDLSIEHNAQRITPVALTILRPDHEMKKNEHGKRRFACMPQEVKLNERKHVIKPVIVCYNDDETIADSISKLMNEKATIAVVTRPFSNGQRFGYKETPVYLNIRKAEQVTKIADSYWRVPVSPQLRLDLPDPRTGLHP